MFEKIRDISDFLSFVKLFAPDRFPSGLGFDGTAEENITMAFSELRESLPLIARTKKFGGEVERIRALLKRSEHLYRTSDYLAGSNVLEEIDHILYPDKVKDFMKKELGI